MKRGGFLPNLFTGLNLFCGFLAVIFSIQEKFELALVSVIAGNIFDVADGRIARSLRSSSRFGAEFDSLADVVTFGVAPSVFLYQVFFRELDKFGIYFPFVFLLAIALRLARFNAEPSKNRRYFLGLSSPLSALWLMTFVLLVRDFEHSDVLIPVATVGISSLAVSRLRFPSFKDVSFGKRSVAVFFVVFSVGVGFLIVEPLVAIITFVSAYICWSILVENVLAKAGTKFEKYEGEGLDIRHDAQGWRAGAGIYDDNKGKAQNGSGAGTPSG